jgi:uncharacterized membrane protein (UPF0127 family)
LEIPVEIADEEPERSIGLAKYDTLAENEGMLFVFGAKTPVHFWMKNMKFAIDMIFIADNKIVSISENAAPEPGVADSGLKLYSPTEPVNYVLEVNAGFVEKNNIKIGDSVVY